MIANTNRRAFLTGVVAAIPAAVTAAPALASVEPDPVIAELEALRGNWTSDNLRAVFRKVPPQVKKLIYMLSREEELIEGLRADARLQKLFTKLEAAYSKWKAYSDGPYAEATKRFEKLAPRLPKVVPWMQPLPAKIAKQLPTLGNGNKRTDLMVAEIELLKKIAPKHPVLALYEQHSKERTAQWTKLCAERDHLYKQCGLEQVAKEQERLYKLCWPIYDKIIAAPAKAAAGLKIKLQAISLMNMNLDGSDNFYKEWESIRPDIFRVHIGVEA